MSHVATHRFSITLITHVRNNDLMLIVGELVSSFVLYRRCFHPSAQPHALIFLQCFSFRNIRYFRAFLRSSIVIFLTCRPCITFLVTSCCNSFLIASALASPKHLKPILLTFVQLTDLLQSPVQVIIPGCCPCHEDIDMHGIVLISFCAWDEHRVHFP